MPLRRLFPRMTLMWEFVIMASCYAAITGLTVWFVIFSVNNSQHQFCQLLGTLTSVHPSAGNPSANPSRAYELKVSRDLMMLKGHLGC